MKKNLYYIIGVLVIPSFIVMFSLFTSNNYQISFGIEQDNSISKIKNIASLINASIANSTYCTITNATTPAVATDEKTGNTYVVYFREKMMELMYIFNVQTIVVEPFLHRYFLTISRQCTTGFTMESSAFGIGLNSELYVV